MIPSRLLSCKNLSLHFNLDTIDIAAEHESTPLLLLQLIQPSEMSQTNQTEAQEPTRTSLRLSFKTSLSNLTDKFRFSKFKSTKSVPQSLSHESSLTTTVNSQPHQEQQHLTPIPIQFQIARTKQTCLANEANEPLYSTVSCKQPQRATRENKYVWVYLE